MKRYFTLLIAVLSFSCHSASAQSFYIADTIYINAGAPIYALPDSLTNNVATPVTLNWKVLETNFPNSWLTTLGICDNTACYTGNYLWPDDSTHSTSPCLQGIQVGLSFSIDLTTPEPTANYYLTVKLTNIADSSDTRTTTLFIGGFPAGIASVNNAPGNISIYPNPANNTLHADWGFNTPAIKNIEIYDIIGRKVASVAASGTKTAIQLGNILPGTYFIRFLDASGKMISTKKFIRQ